MTLLPQKTFQPFLWAIILIIIPLVIFSDNKITYPNRYPAKVLDITDGDTFKTEIYSWPQHSIKAQIRLRGIDTPEIRAKCEIEKTLALRAKARLSELLPKGSSIFLSNVELGTYAGRIIADVATHNFPDIGEILLNENLARRYYVKEGKQSWCP